MFKSFQTAAVLGAGVMGAQIAAHLANAGLKVYLLDLATPDAHQGDAVNRNQLVETAFKKACKLSPPIFFSEQAKRRVVLGNFDEHFDRLAEVDWIIEAVVEKLSIKQQLFANVAAVARPDAVISTNTSGLPIGAIAKDFPPEMRRRFLGTHFFNPPRYLKLLELIATPDTDPEVVARMQWFAELYLGKGVVMAKDTPNFIANRVGVFATMLGIRAFEKEGYSIEEVDLITGPLIGRPKSATFRTADLVGLDTLMYVAKNLHPAVPHDECQAMFQVPEVLEKLVMTGTLGAKTRQGFYKKVKGEILSLNLETLAYEPPRPMDLGELKALKHEPNLPKRLQLLYQDSGRGGQLFRRMMLETLSYSACRIPEIADAPADIDRALRWGFGWEMGPFEIWQVLGFDRVLADMKAAGLVVPAWVEEKGVEGWQHLSSLDERRVLPTVVAQTPMDLDLARVKLDPENTIWQNEEAALLNVGDGVALYEFRSKGNTLSFKVLEGLRWTLDWLVDSSYKGLVIGNDSPSFCGGANLMEMGGLAQRGNWDGIHKLIDDFQGLLNRLYTYPKPIVTAVQGRALGGGCELVLASPHLVAAAESYIGLVELSVGLIPGAGGIMRSVARAGMRASSVEPHHQMPWLKKVFETIAMAKVSNSAEEAVEMGYLPDGTILLMSGDRRLEVAKSEVLCLSHRGYRARVKHHAIPVLGRAARAQLNLMVQTIQQGGYISEYDCYLADRLAYVMTGGDLTAPALVDEDYLLHLERDAFVPLLQQPKTQARMMHLLQHKKPLRN